MGVTSKQVHSHPFSDAFTRQVVRKEVGPNIVDIGQVAQVTLKFRALRQPDGRFVFRELLKRVCVLDDGISTVREI